MNLTSTDVEDREQLRNERKLRKKIKKEQKKQERIQENEKRVLQKQQFKDQHLHIISSNTLETISNKISSNVTAKCNCTTLNLDNQLEFPQLGEHQIKPVHRIHSDDCPLSNSHSNTVKLLSNKKSRKPIEINVAEALEAVKSEVQVEKHIKVQAHKEMILSGNILDSANPERKCGKHREVPKKKKHSQLKSAILKEREKNKNETDPNSSSEIREYCDNILSPLLDAAVKDLLTDLVYFQNRLYSQDPFKGFLKRRYVVGFNEVQKYIAVNKLKLIVIAPNLEQNDAVVKKVKSITDTASSQLVPYVFALSRRILGQVTLKKMRVSCIGIFSFSGSEQNFDRVITLSEEMKKKYIDSLNGTNEANKTNDEIIYSLVNKLHVS